MSARTIVIDPLMEPAAANEMLAICERFGPYGLYVVETSQTEFAPELAQRIDAARNYVRTGGRFGRDEPARVLALRTNYLRESYAYGDELFVDGIERFRSHPALIDAARKLYDRPVIEPAIVYANMLLPGQELAVHTDVPEFRGANRKVIPQWMLVVMHHSGLFEQWRMPIATGIAYFAPAGAEPVGGELAFYPDGPDGAVQLFDASHNTAVVLDTDSVFHGVDRVGPPDTPPFAVAPGNVLVFDGNGRWSIRPDAQSDDHLLDLDWSDIRFSVSWKAYCFADEHEHQSWRSHSDDLTLERILDRLLEDLRDRGALQSDERPPDQELAVMLIDTYERYPAPQTTA